VTALSFADVQASENRVFDLGRISGRGFVGSNRFLAFGRDILVVLLEDAGLILSVLIVPAVLTTLFVVILQRLAARQIERPPPNNWGRHD